MRYTMLGLAVAAAVLAGVGLPLAGNSGTALAHTRCVDHEDFATQLPASSQAAAHAVGVVNHPIANGQDPHHDPAPPASHGINTARDHSPAITGC